MTTMKPATPGIFVILLLVLLPCGHVIGADQRVITDDGREVLLKQDGSWEFLSNDRFANTGDGQRVRLRDDGSWVYIGNAPLVSDRQVRTRELDIRLQQAVIETHEVKVQKNKRVSSQTVFYVQLELSPQAKSGISVSDKHRSLIEVKDNKGRNYPVLSVQSQQAALPPGSAATVVIRADGSPQWWKNVKSMDLVFKPGVFGIQEPVTLNRPVDDIAKKKVDGFDTKP